jgi:hypothetical protein
MPKARLGKPENARRCFKPRREAIADLTRLLAPGDRTADADGEMPYRPCNRYSGTGLPSEMFPAAGT